MQKGINQFLVKTSYNVALRREHSLFFLILFHGTDQTKPLEVDVKFTAKNQYKMNFLCLKFGAKFQKFTLIRSM